MTNRAKPKSATLTTVFFPTRQLRAARSRWMKPLPSRYSIAEHTCHHVSIYFHSIHFNTSYIMTVKQNLFLKLFPPTEKSFGPTTISSLRLTFWGINLAKFAKELALHRRNTIQGVSKKVAPPLKLFGIFSLWLSLFAWNFAKLLAVPSHTFTNFCRFILMVYKMALIFPQIPIVFTLTSFEYSTRKWKCSVPAFQKWPHFFHHVS